MFFVGPNIRDCCGKLDRSVLLAYNYAFEILLHVYCFKDNGKVNQDPLNQIHIRMSIPKYIHEKK